MKKNINVLFGFTIAEFLIAMLISALVAAAMVPVIGLKKVKFPRNKFAHGVAECYYEPTGFGDSNGRKDATGWKLMYYYADNGKKRNASPINVPQGQEYCTFEIPNAEYFEIIAIGAGTDAGDLAEPTFSSRESTPQEGYIKVDSRYQQSINQASIMADGKERSISKELKYILNKWSNSEQRRNELYAQYQMDSPIGAGGHGVCKAQKVASSSCNDLTSGNCRGPKPPVNGIRERVLSDPNYDWYFLHGSGGSSGTGLKTNTPIRVLLDDSIHIETVANYEKTRVYYTHGAGEHNYYEFTASGTGNTPEWNDDGYWNPVSSDVRPSQCFQSSSVIDFCNASGRIGELSANPGSPHGEAHSDTYSCLNYLDDSSQARKGKIYFGSTRQSGTNDNSNESPRAAEKLKWEFTSLVGSLRGSTSGEMGEERTAVYEHLNGKLYLQPAKYQSDMSVQDRKNNLTTVSHQADGGQATVLLSARSASKLGENKTINFSMTNADVPIPSIPLEQAKQKNSQNFNYIGKLSTLPFNQGLFSCDKNDGYAEWCPGYAGSGIYSYMDGVPEYNILSLKNLYEANPIPFYLPIRDFMGDTGITVDKVICDDGKTQPGLFQVQKYHVPDENDNRLVEREYIPGYCKEPKQKGSPGAVIIIW